MLNSQTEASNTARGAKPLMAVKKLLYIFIAIVTMAAAVNMFLAPHSIAAGGLTGLAIILESLFNFERSAVILIGNAAILVLCFIFLGKEVFFNTVIGAMLLPFVIRVIPHVTLVENTMLSMIFGSVMFGIAVSILYNNRASSGGTSIPPLILKKHFNINTSTGLFVTDGIVVVLTLFVFSVDSFFYAIFSIFITSATMSYAETGLNKKKLVFIISDMMEGISNEIMNSIGRGVTIIPIVGAYKKNEMQMLMVALGPKDYRRLASIVKKHDENAFMITDTVSDVHGHGFSYESGTV
jgi:uncharacterized membrane-anchored protein YitT (DUF2179 family)